MSELLYKEEVFKLVGYYYLAASKLRLGLLVNFVGNSLEWKRVVL
jgi:hypothetical protein